MEKNKISQSRLLGIGIVCLALLCFAPNLSAQVVCPLGTFEFVPGVCVLDGVSQPKFVNPVPDALQTAFQYAPTGTKDDTFWPTRPASIPAGNKPLYEIGMYQFSQDLGLWNPTTQAPLGDVVVWGYGDGTGPTPGTYPGKTFIANENQPIFVQWTNNLDGLQSLLPIDTTLTWADPCLTTPPGPYEGPVPLVPHLHGGHTESLSDGLPDAWFLPVADGGCQPKGSLQNIETFAGGDIYYYENTQEAATVWYHDHALGITRTNVYAGLAGFYIIRDGWDTGAAGNLGGIDLPVHPYEQLLVIQDRMFEVTYDATGITGASLYYPTDAVLAGIIPNPDPAVFLDWPGGPSALPEFFGNIMLVNGQVWPKMDVEPRWYRLRLLNGSDSAFYELSLKNPAGLDLPVPKFYQIGSDLGLLNSPVKLKTLVIGPGERADVLVDFTPHPGQQIIMRNNARQPYPKGATIDPNTVGQIMAFNVGPTAAGETFIWDKKAPLNLRQTPLAPPDPTAATSTRQLVLFEGINSYGRLEPMLGTTAGGGLGYRDTVTENPVYNATEIWEFYNATPDAHPIHLHLVNFQIINRQGFKATVDPATGVTTNIQFKGKPIPVEPWETGLKDTVQTYPEEVTRVIATFDKPCWYVWHCHILSHEDHEMMRPFLVGDGVGCTTPEGQ